MNQPETWATFGAQVKSRRLQLGLERDELATAIGSTVEEVRDLERGQAETNVVELAKIGAVLGVAVAIRGTVAGPDEITLAPIGVPNPTKKRDPS